MPGKTTASSRPNIVVRARRVEAEFTIDDEKRKAIQACLKKGKLKVVVTRVDTSLLPDEGLGFCTDAWD